MHSQEQRVCRPRECAGVPVSLLTCCKHSLVIHMFDLFLFYVYGCFPACMFVQHVHVVSTHGRGYQILWSCHYRQPWAAVWVLGVEPRTSARATHALSNWAISPAQFSLLLGSSGPRPCNSAAPDGRGSPPNLDNPQVRLSSIALSCGMLTIRMNHHTWQNNSALSFESEFPPILISIPLTSTLSLSECLSFKTAVSQEVKHNCPSIKWGSSYTHLSCSHSTGNSFFMCFHPIARNSGKFSI
jgi:hypothetical protein